VNYISQIFYPIFKLFVSRTNYAFSIASGFSWLSGFCVPDFVIYPSGNSDDCLDFGLTLEFVLTE